MNSRYRRSFKRYHVYKGPLTSVYGDRTTVRKFTRRIRKSYRTPFRPIPELKHAYGAFQQTISTKSAVYIMASGITAGTGASQRIGAQIQLMGVGFRLPCTIFYSSGGNQEVMVRCLMVMPKQALTNDDVSAYLTASAFTLGTMVDVSRYTVLYDVTQVISNNQSTGIGSNPGSCIFEFYKLLNQRVTYDPSGYTAMLPTLMIVTSLGPTNATNVSVDGQFRASFYDC